MTDPTNVFAMDDIKFMTGYNVEPVVASETAVVDAIAEVLPGQAAKAAAAAAADAAPAGPSALEMASQGARGACRRRSTTPATSRSSRSSQEISAEALAKQGEEAPVVRLVNVVLMSAIQKGASDIHIEPYEKELRVRYRIDGILYNIMSAADEVPRRDHLAHQDHVEARHRREAAAAGRPHQDPLQRQRRRRRRSTSASRACRRCSARRSSCVCSTRTS